MKLGILNFFDDVSNFFRGGRVLGIDIGTVSVKITEISKRGDKFQLNNYGILETKSYLDNPTQVIQAGSLKIQDKEAAALLKILIREMKPKTKTALFSLPSFAVFTTALEMPLFSPQETEKAVMFQARQVIPLPINQVSIDWTKVEEFENEKGQKQQRIFVIGIPNELLEAYKRIARMADLRLVSLELETFSLIRSLLQTDNQISLLVDIGAESTAISVVEAGSLKYSAVNDHGGGYLTQAVTRSLGVSSLRAEELKRRRGILGRGVEFELSTLLLSFLDVIIEGVSNVRGLYERRYGKKVQKIVLTGGGANLMGVDKYFSEQLKLDIYHPSPFIDIGFEPRLESAIKNIGNELAVAVGAAKHYFL